MKQTTRNILGVGAIVLLSSGVAGITTYKMMQGQDTDKQIAFNEVFQQNPNVKLAAFDAIDAQPVDLTQAAENSLHAVVHIKSTQTSKTQTVQTPPDIFDFFFGDGRGGQRRVQTPERVGFGSGALTVTIEFSGSKFCLSFHGCNCSTETSDCLLISYMHSMCCI